MSRAFCETKDLQILICGDALGGTFFQKGSPYEPFQKLLEKGFFTDGMWVQILIYRALCLHIFVGGDVKGLFAILSANRVRFVVDSPENSENQSLLAATCKHLFDREWKQCDHDKCLLRSVEDVAPYEFVQTFSQIPI